MIHRLPGASVWGVEPHLKVDMLPAQMSDSLVLRQNADVMKLDEKGIAEGESPDNPEDLITKGLDLQLQEAIVLLQAQAAAKPTNQALMDKDGKHN